MSREEAACWAWGLDEVMERIGARFGRSGRGGDRPQENLERMQG
jgi:hypothetical protein